MGQVKLIQEMLGYFLIPVNLAQKCFVIVGAGGAGKSKLLMVLNELLLGKENVSNVSWQALNERFKTAELFGKLANVFADLPTKNIDDSCHSTIHAKRGDYWGNHRGRGGRNLYRYGSQGTARGSRVQNREIEDGGYRALQRIEMSRNVIVMFRNVWYSHYRKQ